MPQNAAQTPVTIVAGTPVNVVGATAGQVLKTGKGTLNSVSVNTAGTSSTLVFYDGTSTAGTKLGTFSTTAQFFAAIRWKFTVGLFVVATGTVADVTVSYT